MKLKPERPMTKTPPAVRSEDELALRAELEALRGRVVAIESLLVALYGPGALGSGPAMKQPPAEPAAEPPRVTRRVVGYFSG